MTPSTMSCPGERADVTLMGSSQAWLTLPATLTSKGRSAERPVGPARSRRDPTRRTTSARRTVRVMMDAGSEDRRVNPRRMVPICYEGGDNVARARRVSARRSVRQEGQLPAHMAGTMGHELSRRP